MKTLAVVKTRANFALCLTSTHYTRTHTTVHRYVYTTQERGRGGHARLPKVG